MDPATLDPAGAGAGAGGADGAGDGVDSRTHPDGYWTEAPHSPQLAQDKNGEWPCDLCKGNCCGKTPRGGGGGHSVYWHPCFCGGYPRRQIIGEALRDSCL
jgi:hypothetical protein